MSCHALTCSKFLNNAKLGRYVPLIDNALDNRRLGSDILFSNGRPSLTLLRQHFARRGQLTEECALAVVQQASFILRERPNMVEVAAPVVVFGDIHGYYDDFVRILQTAPDPVEKNYIFLGDYIDRGPCSVEVVLFLFCLLINHPEDVHLIRGNHEVRDMCSVSTFLAECQMKYSSAFYNHVMVAFTQLPLAVLVNGNKKGRVLCVHGGIGPNVVTIDDILKVDRFKDTNLDPVMTDLLWADPIPEPHTKSLYTSHLSSSQYKRLQFTHNAMRSTSVFFGRAAISAFLRRNDLIMLVRGHQMFMEGFCQHQFGDAERKPPYVITVFTAPAYRNTVQNNNRAALLTITQKHFKIQTFGTKSSMVILPNNQDALTFGLGAFMNSLSKLAKAFGVSLKKKPTSAEKKDCTALKLRLKTYFKGLNKTAQRRESFLRATRNDYHINTRLLHRVRRLERSASCPPRFFRLRALTASSSLPTTPTVTPTPRTLGHSIGSCPSIPGRSSSRMSPSPQASPTRVFTPRHSKHFVN